MSNTNNIYNEIMLIINKCNEDKYQELYKENKEEFRGLMISENNTFFDGVSYAFALKPANLRYEVVTVPDPTPQDPANSYESRTMATKYYSYQY
jgi:hypothetical protein